MIFSIRLLKKITSTATIFLPSAIPMAPILQPAYYSIIKTLYLGLCCTIQWFHDAILIYQTFPENIPSLQQVQMILFVRQKNQDRKSTRLNSSHVAISH